MIFKIMIVRIQKEYTRYSDLFYTLTERGCEPWKWMAFITASHGVSRCLFLRRRGNTQEVFAMVQACAAPDL